MASSPRRYVRALKGCLTEHGRQISTGASAREVLALLMLSPLTKRVPGVIRAGVKALSEDFGVPEGKLSKALAELESHGLIAFDRDARLLRVRGAIEADPAASSKVRIAWATDILELPASPVRNEICAAIRGTLDDETQIVEWDRLTQPLSDRALDTLSQSVSHTPVPVPTPTPDPTPAADRFAAGPARVGLTGRRNGRVLNEADPVQFPATLSGEFQAILRPNLREGQDPYVALLDWVHAVSDRTVAAHGGAPREMLAEPFSWWRQRLAEDWGVASGPSARRALPVRANRWQACDPAPQTRWSALCDAFEAGGAIDRARRMQWLEPCRQLAETAAELRVEVPADLKPWIAKHYLAGLEAALEAMAPGCQLVLAANEVARPTSAAALA